MFGNMYDGVRVFSSCKACKFDRLDRDFHLLCRNVTRILGKMRYGPIFLSECSALNLADSRKQMLPLSWYCNAAKTAVAVPICCVLVAFERNAA